MKSQEITNKLIERAKELLTIRGIQKEYESKENQTKAKAWILHQALITLMCPEEITEATARASKNRARRKELMDYGMDFEIACLVAIQEDTALENER
jgi:hypothetical protein